MDDMRPLMPQCLALLTAGHMQWQCVMWAFIDMATARGLYRFRSQRATEKKGKRIPPSCLTQRIPALRRSDVDRMGQWYAAERPGCGISVGHSLIHTHSRSMAQILALICPSSTSSAAPVILFPASLASSSSGPSRSAGDPSRLLGMFAMKVLPAGESKNSALISVRMYPGCMLLTRMPWRAHSRESARVMWSSAALLMAYVDRLLTT
eukprot:scaffold44095_cov309-Isochrysis_galbana.AAC.1